MKQSAFIDMNYLPEEAKSELMNFYKYLLYKYKKAAYKTSDKESENKNGLEDFISTSIETDNFIFLNREERNER